MTLEIKSENLKKLEKIKIVDFSLIKTCASMILSPIKRTPRSLRPIYSWILRGLPKEMVVTKGCVSNKKRLKQFIKRKFTYIIRLWIQ